MELTIAAEQDMKENKKQESFVPYKPAPVQKQEVKFVQATTDSEAREKARELQLESAEEQENTKDWARARP